jgi:NTE family protein
MRKPVAINLALQGGGAHGAFTWGVLDRLLEEEWIAFNAISGTSAGAMNAVMFAEGWRTNGRSGAKELLETFWLSISSKGIGSFVSEDIESSLTRWWLHATHYLSPYDVNFVDINPLRDLVQEYVDFKALSRHPSCSLFIAATHVSTGKLKLFREKELTCDVLLASACLPKIHKAIIIDEEAYWDGGFSANPAVFPLLHQLNARDVVIVLLQSLHQPELPTKAEQIADRMTELGFQGHFMREMRSICDLKKYSKGKWLPGTAAWRLNKFRMHLIENQGYFNEMPSSSKYNTRQAFLIALKEAGRNTAEEWLQNHSEAIGAYSSCDLERLFGAELP